MRKYLNRDDSKTFKLNVPNAGNPQNLLAGSGGIIERSLSRRTTQTDLLRDVFEETPTEEIILRKVFGSQLTCHSVWINRLKWKWKTWKRILQTSNSNSDVNKVGYCSFCSNVTEECSDDVIYLGGWFYLCKYYEAKIIFSADLFDRICKEEPNQSGSTLTRDPNSIFLSCSRVKYSTFSDSTPSAESNLSATPTS